MDIKIIEDKLKTYKPQTVQEEENALREIAQLIALSGLARTDFFKHASFIGGSCLRIAYGLKRFSEDLDFWTLQPYPDFAWQPYLRAVQEEFKAFAFDMVIEDRARADAKRKRAFLKKDSIGKILILTHSRAFQNNKKLTIKFEIDIHSYAGAQFESKNLEFPYSFPFTALDRSSLFASKIAALFDREKEKGRHWYDFAWYIFHQWPLNYKLLGSCISNAPQEITLSWLQQQLAAIVASIDWEKFKKDVRPFISPEEQVTVDSWNKQFFFGYIEGLEYLKPIVISLGGLIADGKGKKLIEQVKDAIAAGASVNDDARNGHRPLQLALTNGQTEVALLLIENNADVNYRDRSGQTPLQAAVNHGQYELAKLLIKKGAAFNPHAPNLGFVYERLYKFLHF
jgi:predicted nucleotidyltransferase component of viral defense system